MENFARNLDWNLLHSFMIVVQEKSMTKAASILHRTQPAVSQAIKRLENSAGVPLLERRKSGLVPTPAGARLVEQVRSIYATISRMPVDFEQAPEAITGKIILHTIDQVSTSEVDTAIFAFFQKYPGVDLEVVVSTTDAIVRAVELGACTVGITDGVIPQNLRFRELLQESFGLYCGASHRLAGCSALSDDELRAEPFIGFTADVLGGKHMGDVTAYRTKASIGQRVRGQSNFVNEVRRMIELGLGIGFLPIHLAEPFVADGDLCQLPPFTNLPTASVFLVANPEIQRSQAEQCFLECIDAKSAAVVIR